MEFCTNLTLHHLMVGSALVADFWPFSVFILDTWNNVFIWVGAESNEAEQEEVQTLAKEYLETSPSKEKSQRPQ